MSNPLICSGLSHAITKKWQSSKKLTKDMLVYPLLICDDAIKDSQNGEIEHTQGLRRFGTSQLVTVVAELVEKGLRSVILFGVIDSSKKDEYGTYADSESGPVIQSLILLRMNFPNLYIICDVCMCEYTSHGHCGILAPDFKEQIKRGKSPILLDDSINRITEIALSYAKYGADSVAPSDMMDGRIKSIKQSLLMNGYGNRVFIMSYSAKFSSELYRPFRDIACSKPFHGDRGNYQFPHMAAGYAQRSIMKDMSEGSDCVIVKPTLFYLDVVHTASTNIAEHLPICVYQVSGEYALLSNASKIGLVDLRSIVFESHESFLRAGASVIISYFTPELLEWLEC